MLQAPREEHLTEQAGVDGNAARRPPIVRRVAPTPSQLAERLVQGDRGALAQAISLVESSRSAKRDKAGELMSLILPHVGGSARVGITGVPGVGKSTFIERLGTMLTQGGLGESIKVAVLAIDPSSTVTGGSVLGDKTRMAKLSGDPNAFVRPSPSSGTLGGVASKTRESMLLCEAAGYGVVIVETVGVGQSETAVAEMTDVFLMLMLPNAGDELQGIKRGLLELADLVAVNKADGDNLIAAKRAAAEHRTALRCMPRGEDHWIPPVLTCSAKTGDGVADVWSTIDQRVSEMRQVGTLADRRAVQMIRWLDHLTRERLEHAFRSTPAVRALRERVESAVKEGSMTAADGARRLLEAFGSPAE